MNPTRKSSAVIVTRGAPEKREVLLVRRHPKLRFFGGYDAFPGGVIDPIELASVGDTGGPPHPESSSLETAFRVCAARELFEETGILVAGQSELSTAQRTELRQQLLQLESDREVSAPQAGPWSERDFEAALLTPVLDITTPPFSARRYETRFFHLALPPGENCDIWPGELVSSEFVDPQQALNSWRLGERLIAPPVLMLLEILAKHDVQGLVAAAQELERAFAAGQLHPAHFSPGIFAAPLKTHTQLPAISTNCFLVGEERFYVIDPASAEPREQQRLDQQIDRMQLAGSQLQGVLLTHHHPDHVGGVLHLCEKYHQKLFAHADCLQRLDSWVQKLDCVEVVDGDVFELGTAPDGSPDWRLTAIHTPGHAKGHLAWLESRYHSLIAGDLLSSISTIFIDPPDGCMATYVESLEKLLLTDVQMILPSHGPAVHTGSAMIRHFIEHRRLREQKIIRILRGGAMSSHQLLTLVYDDVNEEVWPLAKRSLLAGLMKLENDNHVIRNEDRWEWVGN